MVCGDKLAQATHIIPLTEWNMFMLDNTLDFDDLNDPVNAVVLCDRHHTLFDAYDAYFDKVTETEAHFISNAVGQPHPEYRRVSFSISGHPSIPALIHHADVAETRRKKIEVHGEDPDLSSDNYSTEYAGPVSLRMKDVESYKWQCSIRPGDKVMHHDEIFYHQPTGTACYLYNKREDVGDKSKIHSPIKTSVRLVQVCTCLFGFAIFR